MFKNQGVAFMHVERSRRMWVWGVLALSFALVFGCKMVGKKQVVLRVAGWGDVEEARIQQSSVAEFQKLHPEVKVEFIRIPFNEYITKILTQFSAGMAPDVMAINAEQLPKFAENDIFLDLLPFAEKDAAINLKDFYPEALDRYTVNGKLLGIPRDIAPICVIYYNKKAFAEVGLKPPPNKWTLKEFVEYAKALVKRDEKGKVVRWGFVDDWPIWEAWVLNHGGHLVDDVKHPTKCLLDSPEAVAGVQFRADLIYKYHVMLTPSSMTAMGGMGPSDMFMNGTAAMFHGGIWKVPQFRNIKDFDWDVAPFPRGPGGKAGYPVSAAGYGIVKTSPNAQLGYELVRFLAGESGQRAMARTGLAQPAMRSVAASSDFLDNHLPASKKFLLDAVKDGTFKPFDPRTDEWSFGTVGPKLDRVWNGDETASQALVEAAREVNAKFYPTPKK
jgi:ABC-type glycerol-3-phosphate transport system substrate-binding protein